MLRQGATDDAPRLSGDADILRAGHAEPLRRAARQIEPRAHLVGEAPRPGVVDAHGERLAIVRIGDGERGAERPGARRGGVAVGVEAFAGGGALAGVIIAGENFLTRAIAGRFDVAVDGGPSRRVRHRRGGQDAGEPGRQAKSHSKSHSQMLHRSKSSCRPEPPRGDVRREKRAGMWRGEVNRATSFGPEFRELAEYSSNRCRRCRHAYSTRMEAMIVRCHCVSPSTKFSNNWSIVLNDFVFVKCLSKPAAISLRVFCAGLMPAPAADLP